MHPTPPAEPHVATPGNASALARVARLAAASLGAPFTLVTLAEGDGLTVVAAHGLPLAPGTRAVTGTVPCEVALAAGETYAAGDAATDPRLAELGVVRRYGVRGYLGVPFCDGDGQLLGTVCVMDVHPRVWTAEHTARLFDLAALAADELARHREVDERQRVRADEARFRALVEHTSELIALVDRDGRAVYASPAVARVLGHPPARLLGWGVLRLLHADDARAVRPVLAGLLREPGGRRELRVRARHRAGGWRTLHVAAENLAGDPAVGAVVLNARDVTHQAALEAQLGQVQKLEALGRLAGGVAHDFNNLLTVMGTSARFVRDAVRDALPPALSGEAEADLDEIDRAVERAGALTRQLLAFSRARDAAPRPTPLAEVVRGVEKMARRVVGEDVTVAALAEADAGRVLADPGQLEQVLLNLVVNARDAMPDGGVLVLEARRQRLVGPRAAAVGVAPGVWAVLEVSDSGVGMDEATRARAFEPFFTTKPVGQGTGLGLATVYGVVTAAGGCVQVQSRPGHGTTVTVLLPALDDAADEGAEGVAAEGGDAAEPASPAREGETVLLVEDDATVRHVARRVLERQGYQVLEARHGAEALRVWQAHGGPAGRVDLVLTDLTMPELGGPELVTRLRARRPGQAVVVMTGYASIEPRAWAEAHGLAVVDKPFPAPALARVVRAAIDQGAGAKARGRPRLARRAS